MKKLSKITESIWSDMQDRSAGDTVREEDKITTNRELRKKIYELYIEQGEGETLDVSNLIFFSYSLTHTPVLYVRPDGFCYLT